MSDTSLGPLPKTVKGGCLCTAVRYSVNFPTDHDFSAKNAICQCTQCRKQTGSVFAAFFLVPLSAVEWQSKDATTPGHQFPAALKTYSASETGSRGFCGSCGSFLFWRRTDGDRVSLTVGSLDGLYLFGDRAGEGEGADVPAEGFGRAICNGRGIIEWCDNEIKGVTDDIPLLWKGKRNQQDSE
ncbi:glutathione-dependent formaldehyde-activating GFA [Plectosphaerella cucumerina]|uniref:Glutathione-dependent formaldehyde-activating GFA n=1 Tax=Plectosphaerella cucumerina TaxID=40658 RepID=A0A8K0X605_9PEZI|nr:glutathione-dependent formaldehyde-activating GFA [Plectosphaerella cucumerina]